MNLHQSKLYLEDIDRALNHVVGIEALRNKSILVTGATGTIGSFVADALIRYSQKNDAGTIIYLGGRNIEKLRHQFGVQRNVEFLPYDMNAHIGFDVHVDSFAELYSGYLDVLSPRSCYPLSKRMTENLCSSYWKQYGVESVIVRPCHTYGPYMTETDNRAHAQFFRNALAGENIILKSAGTQMRSYNYVADCAAALLSVLVQGISGEAYNLANPHSKLTIAELAEKIAVAGHNSVVFEIPDAVDLANQSPIQKQVLNSAKIEKLGWRPAFEVEEGICHTLDILRGL